MSDSKLKSNLLLTSSNLKPNSLLTKIPSALNLKSSTLFSQTTTNSSLISSPSSSSALLSKLSNTNTLLSEQSLVNRENQCLQLASQKKKLETSNASLDLEVKKLKVYDDNNLIQSTNTLSHNLLLKSSNQQKSLLTSAHLSSLKKFHQQTYPLLNNFLTTTTTTKTNAKIVQKINAPINEPRKRPFFHLDSQYEQDQDDSFMRSELERTQSLIDSITNENGSIDAVFQQKRKQKVTKIELIHEQSVFSQRSTIEVQKSYLVNVVSAALLRQPDFKNQNDQTRNMILNYAEQIIANNDPEFILKLALYTRKELNVRVVANFLLCLASFKPECRPFLKRYFKQSVVLPTDWIEIAEQYQLFMDKRINFGSLPHALRKCMMDKFPDFDQYQLAKYNKEKARMAKNKKIKDLKHVKGKLKHDETDDAAKITGNDKDKEDLVEDKYIWTWKKGLKINDRILFEVVVGNEKCSNLKFDIINRDDEEEDKSATLAMARARKKLKSRQLPGTEKKENNDQIAMRINLDYTYQRITHKSFLKKMWTANKFSDCVNNPKEFDFKHSMNPTYFFIDVLSDAFQFGIIKSINGEINLSKYLHRKHNILLSKLNCFRLSGVGVKLRDIKIQSKDVVTAVSTDENEVVDNIKQRSFTLKQLIRQLHISQPNDSVMALLGKKYPATFEEFMQLRLPGVFDSTKANKRMKLPIPETWETQISLKGNKASVWEQLIDNKKLPYMAMLRNLRNMIVCGISDKHHHWVTRKLQDEGAVVNSKLFPFRFFTAYEVLDDLESEFNKYIDWSKSVRSAEADSSVNKRKIYKKGKKEKKEKISDVNYDLDILHKYKSALDNALKVATSFNMSPIKGRTAIFLDMGSQMNMPPGSSAKGLGKSVTSLADIASLLALMFNYSCEYSKLVVYMPMCAYSNINLITGTILENMKSLRNVSSLESVNRISSNSLFPRNIFVNILLDKEMYDNVVILSCGIVSSEAEFMCEFLRSYRTSVNPHLLFVNVNLGVSDNLDQSMFSHENDVNITGFSDSILRFVAERSNQGQLTYIENIDRAYELPTLASLNKTSEKTSTDLVNLKIDRPLLKLYAPTPKVQWKSLKVFISSTFRDMHSERDLLTCTVFPMLRAKLNSRLINLYEIDLRWGITEDEADHNQTLDLCLSQVLASDYFIGILGERYGHIPPLDHNNEYVHRKVPELAWLAHYNERAASITELEIQTQLNKNTDQEYQRTFFYFRDSRLLANQVPLEHTDHLYEKNPENLKKLENLKQKLRHTSYEIFDGYPCQWLTYDKANNRVLLTGMDQFARRVFNNLFKAILNEHGNHTDLIELDEFEHWSQLTNAYANVCAQAFVGRQRLIKKFEKQIQDNNHIHTTEASTEASILIANKHNSMSDVYLIRGEAGCGKTTFLSHFVSHKELRNLFFNRFLHIVGAFPGSQSLTVFLKRLCIQIVSEYGLGSDLTDLKASNEYRFFKVKLPELLEKLSAQLKNYKFYIIVDGVDALLDEFDSVNHSFDWMPQTDSGSNIKYANIAYIFTARSTSPTKQAVNLIASQNVSHSGHSHIRVSHVDVDSLDLLDKSDFVRQSLAKFGKYLEESSFNNQLKLLTGKRDAISPFYLTLACEELRLNAQFENLSAKLKELPIKLAQLIDYVISNLEDNYGAQFVRAVFMFICCSREGLEEQELDKMLNIYLRADALNLVQEIQSHNSVLELDRMTVLTKIIGGKAKQWSTLRYASFVDAIRQTFLSPNSNKLLNLKQNEAIENCIKSRYVNLSGKNASSSLSILTVQKFMAIYYWHSIDENFQRLWKVSTSYQRGFTYLPFYLSKAGLYSDLSDLMTDFKFLAIKSANNEGQGALELMEDFNLHRNTKTKSLLENSAISSKSRAPKISASASSSDNNDVLNSKRFLDYKRFFTTNFHLIAQDSDLIYQQAINQPSSSQPYNDLKYLLKTNSKSIGANLFIWLNKTEDPESAALEPISIKGIASIITTVTISPNGLTVACGTADCDVRVYSLYTASLIRTLQGHSGEITSLVFVGDEILASASADGKASIWNVKDGFRIKVLNKHNGHVVSGICAEKKSGKMLVTVGWDCSIKLWAPQDGSLIGELKGLTKPINCVAFDPTNENMIATGSWDSCIRLFNIVDRSRKAVMRGHATSIRSISYSFNGVYIASASIDGQVKLWNSRNGLNVATLKGHAMPVNSLCFSPNSQFLATGSSDRRVRVWTGSVGKLIRVIKEQTTITDEKKVDQLTSVCFNPVTGDSVVVGSHSGFLKIYNTHSGELKSSKKIHNAFIKRVKYTHDGRFLVTAADDGTSCLVNVSNESSPRIVADLVENTRSIHALALSAQNQVVTGSDDGVLFIYANIIANSTKMVDQTGIVHKLSPNQKLYEHKSAITACSFNLSGDKFASASKDATFIIWSIINERWYELYNKNSAHLDWITDLHWSKTCLVTCSNDYTVKIWDNDNLRNELVGHTENLNTCMAGYGYVVSGSSDGTLKVWSEEKSSEVTTLYGHQGSVNACDLYVKVKQSNDTKAQEIEAELNEQMKIDWFDENNKQQLSIESVFLASVSDDGTLRIWKPIESDSLLSLDKHNSRVNSVSLTNSGMLASASSDQSINVYNVNSFFNKVSTGLHVVSTEQSTRMHYAEITSLVAVNRSMVLSGSLDGYLLAWRIANENESPSEIRFVDDVLAHERAVSSICILETVHNSEFRQTRFVTGSHDKTIKIWMLKEIHNPELISIELVKIVTLGQPVIYMNVLQTSKGDKFLLAVLCSEGSEIIGNLFKCTADSLKAEKGGFKLIDCTSLFTHIHLNKKTNTLLIGLVHDEIITVDLEQCIKSWKTLSLYKTVDNFSRFSNGKSYLKLANNYGMYDKQFYTTIQQSELDAYRPLFAGDFKGDLYISRKEGEIFKVKGIHSDEVTELLVFNSRNERVISASRDGFIKVWTGECEEQLGQYSNKSGAVTKLIKIGEESDNEASFIFGDQMGNVNMIRWHESI